MLRDRSDIRISLIYVAVSVLWILFSDRALFAFFPDLRDLQTIGTIKGLAFVSASGMLLFFLLYRDRRLQLAAERERRRMESEREALLAQLQMHIDRMPIGYVVTDTDFRFVSLNPAAERIFGYTSAELKGRLPYGTILREESSDRVEQLREAWNRGDLHAHATTRNLTKRGDIIVCDWFNTPVLDESGRLVTLISMVQDVTGMTRMVDELIESRTRLRALAARLDEVREEERIALSREIHDGLGQLLTGLNIDLTLLGRYFSGGREDGDGEIPATLASMRRLVDDSIAQTRDLARQLRPGMLDEVGLAEAIRQFSREYEQRSGTVCTLHLPQETDTLTQRQRLALYRITQEAMTNIARHAGARNVEIEFTCTDTSAILELRDDGIGVRPGDLRKPASLGIVGMTERAQLLGGHCLVQVREEGGTRVRVEVPLTPETVIEIRDTTETGGTGN